MYVGVHLFYLGGVGGRRISVGITALSSVFGAREGRVIDRDLSSVERDAAAAAGVAGAHAPEGPQT
jgi:hypothetical protein